MWASHELFIINTYIEALRSGRRPHGRATTHLELLLLLLSAGAAAPAGVAVCAASAGPATAVFEQVYQYDFEIQRA